MNETLNVSFNEEPCENHTCSICLEENIEEEELSTTNCSHSFCNKCLEDWLNNGKYSCPLCRNEMKSFITNNIQTRILPVLIGSDMSTINNIPVSTIHTLAYYNARLRCGLYLSIVASVILSYDYWDLLDRYNQCATNLTRQGDIYNDIYNDIYREQIPVALYDKDYVSLRICDIPQYYYNKCFH